MLLFSPLVLGLEESGVQPFAVRPGLLDIAGFNSNGPKNFHSLFGQTTIREPSIPESLNALSAVFEIKLQLIACQLCRLIGVRLDPFDCPSGSTQGRFNRIWILGGEFLLGVDDMSWVVLRNLLLLAHQFHQALFGCHVRERDA